MFAFDRQWGAYVLTQSASKHARFRLLQRRCDADLLFDVDLHLLLRHPAMHMREDGKGGFGVSGFSRKM
jgi:hypothetical protein